jgi:hypothetical protein
MHLVFLIKVMQGVVILILSTFKFKTSCSFFRRYHINTIKKYPVANSRKFLYSFSQDLFFSSKKKIG